MRRCPILEVAPRLDAREIAHGWVGTHCLMLSNLTIRETMRRGTGNGVVGSWGGSLELSEGPEAHMMTGSAISYNQGAKALAAY